MGLTLTTGDLALLTIFPVLMAYAAASDLLTMRIPNRLSLLLVAAFCVFAAVGGLGLEALLLHVAAGALVLTVAFGLFAFGWIGGGDAKLAAATALWFGFPALSDYLSIASILGGGLSAAILLLRRVDLPPFASGWTWLARLHDPKSGVPYGIALSAAALAIYPDTAIWTALVAG